MSSESFIRLRCAVQPYPYGRKGSASAAARYAAATPENNFTIKEDQPYGEIWMGDHPNGPAHAIPSNKPLADLIAASPEEYLTPAVYKKFHNDPHLPFLFKVLSFEKALPLQAHPDRSLAGQLKKQEKQESGKNETFVDPNHKPEVAVTISELFEGFVGFRPINEIKTFLKEVPELRSAVSDDATVEKFLAAPEQGKETEELLKKVFADLMRKHDQKKISELAEQLLGRVQKEGDAALGALGKKQNLAPIVEKIMKTYPGDIGLFAAVFFMNFCRLKEGEGIAVPADCIHAYLEGDVIECMAWSDNMIACGFEGLEDRQDVNAFIDMLLYQASESKKLELKHSTWSKSDRGKTTFYDIPMEEFDLLNTRLAKGEEEVVPEGINGPAVFIVTKGDVELSGSGNEGEGTKKELLKQGQVVFIKPKSGYRFKAQTDNTQVWAAFVEA